MISPLHVISNSLRLLASKLLIASLNKRINPRLRSEDDIKMDLKDIKWKGVEWIHLAGNRGQWRLL
jgi:hypothetical protein